MANARGGGRRADQVAAQLERAIADGDLELGAMLSEDVLAEAFGVSRTPVREALHRLEQRGLVNVAPKSGTFVFVPTEDQIAELCDFRIVLELTAVGITFATAREEAAQELATVVDDMAQAMAAGDLKSYAAADSRFHQTFFTHCRNRYLSSTYDLNVGQIAALRTHLAANTEGEPQRSFDDHAAISDMFVAGDGADLDEVLRQHILRTKDNYMRNLRERTQLRAEPWRDQVRRIFKVV